jgi:predicted dithiol-disulfide oxidoreductase (DUF899 family)
MTQDANSMQDHAVVSRQEWLSARTAFLAKEKEFTRLRDELNRQRRALPWVRVDKAYVFEGPDGRATLAELFGRRSQLVVYHFMFSPEWDAGCPHCSFWADHYDGMLVHLDHRDVSFVVVSRAPLAKIEAFKRRMGWRFGWVSSSPTDFNFDFSASFTLQDVRAGSAFYNFRLTDPGSTDRAGLSVFYKDDHGTVFHTYSTYARGIDLLNGAYNCLDLAPKGRDEDGLESRQAWVRYHDQYED